MDLKKIDNKKSSTKKLSRITIQQPQTIHLIDTFTRRPYKIGHTPYITSDGHCTAKRDSHNRYSHTKKKSTYL